MPRHPFVVGLTGGIGSGKSTVADLFAEQGIELVDADLIAREVVEPGQPAITAIVKRFGPEILLTDGTLDRAQLRQRVFVDPAQRQWLETLTHPLIRQLTEQRLQQAQSPYVMLVSPLLLETDQHQLCDHIVVVDLPEEEQIQRSSRRDNNSEVQIKAIMQAQCNRQQRLEKTDSLIDNSGTLGALPAQVQQLHLKLLQLAKQHTESNHADR